MAAAKEIIIYASSSTTKFKAAPSAARKKCTLNKFYISMYPSSQDSEDDTIRVEDLVTKKATVTADCEGNSTPTTLGEVWDAILNFHDPNADIDAAGLWMVADCKIRLTRDGKRKASAGGKRNAADVLQQVRTLDFRILHVHVAAAGCLRLPISRKLNYAAFAWKRMD